DEEWDHDEIRLRRFGEPSEEGDGDSDATGTATDAADGTGGDDMVRVRGRWQCRGDLQSAVPATGGSRRRWDRQRCRQLPDNVEPDADGHRRGWDRRRVRQLCGDVEPGSVG